MYIYIYILHIYLLVILVARMYLLLNEQKRCVINFRVDFLLARDTWN